MCPQQDDSQPEGVAAPETTVNIRLRGRLPTNEDRMDCALARRVGRAVPMLDPHIKIALFPKTGTTEMMVFCINERDQEDVVMARATIDYARMFAAPTALRDTCRAMLLAAMRIPVDERAAHKNDLEVVAGALFIMAEMHVMLNRIIPPWVFEQAKDILTSNTENGE